MATLTRQNPSNWNSDVYQHLKPAEILIQNGEKVWKGDNQCTHSHTNGVYVYVKLIRHSVDMWISNPLITHMHQDHNHSTGNLNNHVWECNPRESRESKAMARLVVGFTYTCEGFRFQIAKWITKCCCPLSIIGDEELIDSFCMLHAPVIVPSWFSVRWDIHSMYAMMKSCVISMFEVRLSIGHC